MNEGGQFEDSFAARLHGESFAGQKKRTSRRAVIVAALIALVILSVIGVFFIINNSRDDHMSEEEMEKTFARVFNLVFNGEDSDVWSPDERLNASRSYVIDDRYKNSKDTEYFNALFNYSDSIKKSFDGNERLSILVNDLNAKISAVNQLLLADSFDEEAAYSSVGGNESLAQVDAISLSVEQDSSSLANALNLLKGVKASNIKLDILLSVNTAVFGEEGYCLDYFGCMTADDYLNRINELSEESANLELSYMDMVDSFLFGVKNDCIDLIDNGIIAGAASESN